MASSQVEIAPSSPFGCVLRDHNRRDRYSTRDSNAFEKNFKDLWVHNPPTNNFQMDSCISGQTRNSNHSGSNENSHHHIDNADLWVHIPSRNNNNNKNDHRKSEVVNRWDRARDMLLTMGRMGQDALSSSSESSVPAFQRENSPAKSESSVEIPNLRGVSSIVQRWRNFEAEAKSLNSPVNATSVLNSPVNTTACSSRSNSGSSFTDNVSFIGAPPQGSDTADESAAERLGIPPINEDSFGDWESDKMALASPPPSRAEDDSDATERERLRVADIIRKLTSTSEDNNDRDHSVGNELLTRVRTPADHHEQRVFSPVVSSPRIRGRQAFSDLLMQIERDRQQELEGLVEHKAVSRFSQKGRIQALLRLKLLRRGVEDRVGRVSSCSSAESNRLPQSAITHLRERFNPGSNPVVSESRTPHRETVDSILEPASSLHQQQVEDNSQQKVVDQRSTNREVEINIKDLQNSPPQLRIETNHHSGEATTHHCSSEAENSGSFHRESVSSSSDTIWQVTVHEVNHPVQRAEATILPVDHTEEIRPTEEPELTVTNYEQINDTAHLQSDWEDESNDQHLAESDCGWVSDYSHPQNGWDELQSDYQQQIDNNQDWVTELSRPKSEWEGLRQARYQEMLDPFVDNEDIRQLLQRKSVSSFLSSSLRENIDRLMLSRSQQPANEMRTLTEEEEEPRRKVAEAREKELKEEKVAQDEVGLEDDVQEEEYHEQEVEEEEEEDTGYDDKYESHQLQRGQQYNEVDDPFHETRSSISLPSWNQNQDHEINDDSDQVASTSLQQSLSSDFNFQGSRPCSSCGNRASIEMELIYDLRGHMEQLHQEISELRQSVKSCVNMQMKLQRCIKHEVAAALGQSGSKRARDSTEVMSNGFCSICCETQVDSLLYRCGHMCTCFKCAQDLQQSSGQCPICRAPIIDIVRVYTHS